MIGRVGRRGLASVALTLLALALLGVGVMALAWWPERQQQTGQSKPGTARVLQSAPCGAATQGDLVEARVGGKPVQTRFDGCGHTQGQQLQVLLPDKAGAKARPLGSDAGSSGGSQRLMWVLLTVAGVAGGGYALLLPHLRRAGDEAAPEPSARPERRPPQPAPPPRTRGPALPPDHPSAPNPAPLDPNATLPPAGPNPAGPSRAGPSPAGPSLAGPSPGGPSAVGPGALPPGHPSGPNPLPPDPNATLPPTEGQGPRTPPLDPDLPTQPPLGPASSDPLSPVEPRGPVPPARPGGMQPPVGPGGPVPRGAGGFDEPVPNDTHLDRQVDPVPAEPDDEPRSRRPGKSRKPENAEKPEKPGGNEKPAKAGKIEQLKEARRKRKENPFI